MAATWASKTRNRYGCPLVSLEPGMLVLNEAALPNFAIAWRPRRPGFYAALFRLPWPPRRPVRLRLMWSPRHV
jgi:hypothetical protein